MATCGFETATNPTRKAEKDAEKELRDAQKRKKQGLGPSKASILGLPDPEETQEEKVDEPGEQERQETKAKMSHKDMKDTLASFKDRFLERSAWVWSPLQS
jgi:hypothetical protein